MSCHVQAHLHKREASFEIVHLRYVIQAQGSNWIGVSVIGWGSVTAHSVLFWALVLELLVPVSSSESSVSPIFSLFSVSSIGGEAGSAGKRCSRCSGQGLQQRSSSVGEIFFFCNFSRTGADGSSCTAYHNELVWRLPSLYVHALLCHRFCPCKFHLYCWSRINFKGGPASYDLVLHTHSDRADADKVIWQRNHL